MFVWDYITEKFDGFIEWFKRDPFWNTVMILAILSMGSCTLRTIVNDWVK